MYGSVVERVHVFRLFSCVDVGFKDEALLYKALSFCLCTHKVDLQ